MAPSGQLICPPHLIFDQLSVLDQLANITCDNGPKSDVEFSSHAVKILNAAQVSGRDAIEKAFAKRPTSSEGVTQAYSYLTDCLVNAAYWLATEKIHPNTTPSAGDQFAVIAVGGYGRGEMAPYSDVDLLFLTPFKITPWVERVIETILYVLWDLKLHVGHSSRSLRDCLHLARDDITIRTSLLERRFLCGAQKTADILGEKLWRDLFSRTARNFIAAKLSERDERHRKHGGNRYILEPNVKEAKGGLRDLQTLYWIAKYRYNVQNVADLVSLNVFSNEEFESFESAGSFLWAVRCHLHILANRGSDILTFDQQVEVAKRMGYRDHTGRRGVEHFMQNYFRHATKVGEVTRILLTALEADNLKDEPGFLEFFKGRRRRRLKAPYGLKQGRLTIIDQDMFLANKLNLLRVFEEALRSGLLLHPDTMRLVVSHLHLIDQPMREDPEANRLFLDLLLKHGNPERALRRMNELGVLAAFLPEFAPIVAMMQFNTYHSYTVDEHTIQVISNLAEIEQGLHAEDLPLSTKILRSGVNRRVLYVALLLHDIGKGRSEDHSILGAQIARKVTPRLGLKREECETVEWLVRHHLLMSDMTQKRDISDPRTIRDFAKAVKTKKRLDLLTLLTVCDIRGVGPNVWNNWKAQMIRAFYRATDHGLAEGLEAINLVNREAKARRLFRAALPDWSEADLRAEIRRHYSSYWQGLPTMAQVRFAYLLKDLPDDEIRVELEPDPDRDATRAIFALANHPGIFARLTGALTLVSANIVDARIFTSKDGYATTVFWLQDHEGKPFDMERLPRLHKMIEKTLHGQVIAREALESHSLKKRERSFNVPTSITFDNEGSDIYTIIEVDTRDRPGLLYDLAHTLASANISISSAMIATYGAQVVDTFYVKDMFGLKLHAAARQKDLEKRLRAAIARVAERAGA